MKYTNLYRNIKNPLDDEHVLEQIIEAYTEDTSFYSALTKRHSKNKRNVYNATDCDNLHAYLFNTWKKELLSITKEQYEKAIRDGLYDRDIYKLLAFLKTVPNVTTRAEAMKILDANYQDSALEDAMEKYRWDTTGLYSGWTHIDARYVHGKKTKRTKIEHRLYLNTAPTDVHTMSKLFLEKCIAKKLPYYFKIGEFDRRDDNIVIYSDTENLPKYLQVLSEIEKEHPELIARCGNPPILSGVIHNWIGYGSEPLKLTGESSFNSERAKSIEKALEEEMKSWYKKYMSAQIKENGKSIPLYDYLCNQVIERKLNYLVERLRRAPNSKWIKYTDKELSNPAFLARLEKEVKAKSSSIIKQYLTGTKVSTTIDVPINNSQKMTIYSSDIIKELKRFVAVINANDPDFKNRVKARIIQDAPNYGIDPNNYCFDKDNVDLLVKAEQSSEKKPVKKQIPVQPVKKSTEDHQQRQQAQDIPIYHRPAGTPMSYKPMTDAEILEARKKLAECPPVKVKRR